MPKSFIFRTSRNAVLAIATTLFVGPVAMAKVDVNSMCHMKFGDSIGKINGDENKNQKYPLASISKVVTSAWAVEKWGPLYRFKTKFHIDKVSEGLYDVHIEGSRDPIMGRNAAYFIMSELNRSKYEITKIRNLTFDQDFIIDWLAEEKPRLGGNTPYYETLNEQTTHVMRTLRDGLATALDKNRYNSLKSKAASIGVEMAKAPSLEIGDINYLSKADFRARNLLAEDILTYNSAPLFRILKRMNNQSNNYIADHLFWNLGGTLEFNKYIQAKMSLSTADLDFYLGSGNNANYIFDTNRNVYNEGSCSAMVKVLYFLDKNLAKFQLRLADVMAVAGEDSQSTVRGFTGPFFRSTVAKTGSVNKAKTLSGSIKTVEGSFYFTILLHTDGQSDWGAATQKIKRLLDNLIDKYGGPVKENYEEVTPLPFDKMSGFTPELDTATIYTSRRPLPRPAGETLP